MKHRLLLLTFLLGAAISGSAERLWDVKPDYHHAEFTLTAPELEPKLVYDQTTTRRRDLDLMVSMPATVALADQNFHWSWMDSKPGVKPYKFMDDMTFVGVPLFVAGWAVKGDKAMFRVNNKDGKKNTQLLTDFKTSIDDYTQYFGPVMVVGLKAGGVEGRSSWGRMLASAALSYGIMASFVNGIKYTAKEMRPDGSSANSWPSGHTATSFVGATLLHKEYGLTRSPWYSIAGYGVATATGVMRVLNHRHWVSDVMSGAGIGILSTELGYALGDLIFKERGLLRNDVDFNSETPSFFSISMGLGIGGKDVDFDLIDDLQDWESHGLEGIDPSVIPDEFRDINIDFRAATVVDAEGAYFFNKYVGVGGRLRVRAMSAKSFGRYADLAQEDDLWMWSDDEDGIAAMYKNMGMNLTNAQINQGGKPVDDLYAVVKSDHLAEFTGSVGLYFNLPLTRHLSLGTKCLIGRSFMQELDINGVASGHQKGIDYTFTQQNNEATGLVNTTLTSLGYPQSTGETWTDEWDYVTLGAETSTSFGTGLCITYKYKSNFSWRLFCDYDYSKKTYTLTADPYHYFQKMLTYGAYDLVSNPGLSTLAYQIPKSVFKKDKKMNYWTIGLSFLVNL